MRTALVLVMAAGSMLATGAFAQTAPTPPQAPQTRGMLRADANGDGTITRAEYIAQTEARIAAMDTNKDGVISPEERAAARQAMWAQRRGGAAGEQGSYGMPGRGGGDGGNRGGGKSVTRAEMVARAGARFDRMDTNHDGRLDVAEMAAARSALHHGRRGGDAPAGQADAQ